MKNVTKYVGILMTVVMMICMFPTMDTVNATTKKTLKVSMEVRSKNHSCVVKTLKAKQKGYVVVKYGGKTVKSKITYKSNNKKIATVSKKGVVTAKKAGKCTITVKYKGKVKKLKITVKGAAGDTSNKTDKDKDKTTEDKKHVHNWIAYYYTKKVQRVGVHRCNCGYMLILVPEDLLELGYKISEYFKTKGLEIPVEIMGTDSGLEDQHTRNHILNREPSNYWTLIAYEIVKYVGGYECDCGADKDPVGDEPEIDTGEYVIDW